MESLTKGELLEMLEEAQKDKAKLETELRKKRLDTSNFGYGFPF